MDIDIDDHLFVSLYVRDNKWYVVAARPLGCIRVSSAYGTWSEAMAAMAIAALTIDIKVVE